MSEGQSLKEKTAKGLFWGGFSNGIQQLLNLVFGIFLARLLNASDYGMVGMLTIFSLIAGSLQESGFVAALTNKKEITHQDYNAVFWFSSGLSLCLYTLLFFCAPLIADFYQIPELTALARFSFLGFFIASLGTSQSAYLFRNLQVKQKTTASLIGLIISGIIGILMAYCGFSYWGIATQSLVYVSVTTACFWHYSPWRPTLHIELSPLKKMFSFSAKLLITNIFNNINNNLFSIILGKFYSEKEVGYFNQANKWNMMGHSFIAGMISNIAQPTFVQVSENRDRQLRIFRKMLRFTAFVSFPLMLGLSLIAPDLIIIAITDKWAESARILQIISIGGAFVPITTLYTNLIISKGKSNIYMWNTICLGLLQLFSMLMLYPYGIHTMIVFYIIINTGWLLIWQYFVWREIRITLLMTIKDVFPFFIIALSCMLLTYLFTLNINNIYFALIAKISIAAFLYIGVMWGSNSVTFKECLNYLLKKV